MLKNEKSGAQYSKTTVKRKWLFFARLMYKERKGLTILVKFMLRYGD